MASASLRTDVCSYDEKLRRSVGPGMYMLGTPANDMGNDCSRDVPSDPYVRYQSWGPGACAPGRAVDDGSELLGINYKASKCSGDAYAPGKYRQSGICSVPGKSDPRACAPPTEDTRLSNPPCTLRCTGWNRWEWLCYDPQERALIPFEWNVSYRAVAKDNHTPCIERPIDQTGFVPPGDEAGVKGPVGSNDPVRKWIPAAACAVGGGTGSVYAPGNPFDASTRTVSQVSYM